MPIDSEHVAIHQLLRYADKDSIRQVILTASGGPFYSQSPLPDFSAITPAKALKHPTWQMGKKVTIDSATLANKGIELLEAHYLFGIEPEKLNVVIHPQSMIHAMVELKDGSILSQMAYPDMRLPIAYALFFPKVQELSYIKTIEPKEFPDCTFIQTQTIDIPIIRLALDCVTDSFLSPLFYVLADEIAVEAFLNLKIRFEEIPGFLQYCITELKKNYSVQKREQYQKEMTVFIHDIKQNSQRLLIQFKKQVV